MRKKELLFAFFILAAGVVYEVMALRMPRGTILYPGPGFYPSIVGTFLLLVSGAFILGRLFRANGMTGAERVATKTTRRGKTLLLIALLLFYCLTLNSLGFLLAISLFMIAAVRIFGYRRWLPLLGISAGIVAVSYLVFVVWLSVPLPRGMVENLLEGLSG
ncbi:MAG TPA: tripartite tricarboxylate transporter TctB family protein [Thermodesulfobacteriota bacterium]|nr:tripartite tricarboxylate transporter TctB family protein [Thermodesulfobacteriota bacterium]